MRVTVCQLPDDRAAFAEDWRGLCEHARAANSELVLLPELPFAVWFGANRPFDLAVWNECVRAHAACEAMLPQLAPAHVLSTRPINRDTKRFNEAFGASPAGACTPAHLKRYLPDEEGYWEASWYDAGKDSFNPTPIADARIGVRICTDIWTFEASRLLGLAGANVIAVPRATPAASVERWIVAGRATAMTAGAFCISSNRSGQDVNALHFGGAGWIIDPDGDVLALTSDQQPFVTREIDLNAANAAKTSYPRYVR
jgi:N-carbamoylputrescine amidase